MTYRQYDIEWVSGDWVVYQNEVICGLDELPSELKREPTPIPDYMKGVHSDPVGQFRGELT